MDKIKKALKQAVTALLASDPLLSHSSYQRKDKNGEKVTCFSIFGFEITQTSMLSQDAKDVIKYAKQLGHNSSYLPPSRFNDSGSIYIGPASDDTKTVDEGIDAL